MGQPQRHPATLFSGNEAFRPAALRRLYLDADLIALRPHLVHFEFGPLARGCIGLRERLGWE